MPLNQRNQVFICYSREDKRWLEKLQTQLKPLIRANLIQAWDDTKITPGSQWRLEIENALRTARVAVLLVSPNFLASDFIAQHELPPLLNAAKEEGVIILWFALAKSLYKETSIAEYQSACDPNRPLNLLTPGQQDVELVKVCEAIKSAFEGFTGMPPNAAHVEALDAHVTPPQKPQALVNVNPYKGLSAFTEEDSPHFFGREYFTEQLIWAVEHQPFVAVIGASGAGKSSIVFAGLVPFMRRRGDVLIASFRPSRRRNRPLHSLAAVLIGLLQPEQDEVQKIRNINSLAESLKSGREHLRDYIERIIEIYPKVNHVLLVIDQFEEIYTLYRDEHERRIFLDLLLEAGDTGSSNYTPELRVVLTLRADFFGHALTYRPLSDVLQRADLKLGPMNVDELWRAIEQPALQLGCSMQGGLVERIIKDISRSPGNLPLLEFAMTQLWEKRKNNQLTHAAYDEIGGVENALTLHAERVYEQLNAVAKEQAKSIFIQLVRPGDGTEDTRRLALRRDIGDSNWDLVDKLAKERLVVTGTETESKTETVEIVHEALIRSWKRLNEWLEEVRDFRIWQEHLRGSIRAYESSGNLEGFLLQGIILERAEEWARRMPNDVSLVERNFLLRSRASEERQMRKDGNDEKGDKTPTELDTVNMAKNEFLSRMSHELRTPLNGILGFAQVLEGYGGLDRRQREAVTQISLAGWHLLSLINEILDISRSQNQMLLLETEPIVLERPIDESIDLVRSLAEIKRIRIEKIDSVLWDCKVFSDYLRLKQVVLNLLSNAIKYNLEDGSVQISVELSGEKFVRLNIIDTGVGLSEEQMARLFVPFERLDVDSKGIEGTGIGLALSRALMEAMSGNIGVESTTGEGSTFWIEIPRFRDDHDLIRPNTRAMIPAEVTSPESVSGIILILNSDDIGYQIITSAFQDYPQLQILPPATGEKGVEVARQFLPDVILLDLSVSNGEMDSFEVLKHLKSDEDLKHTQVIILTSDVSDFALNRIRSMEVYGYVSKPIMFQELRDLLTQAMSKN